jgi:UDP-N-acetylglucosamine 2-epimerase
MLLSSDSAVGVAKSIGLGTIGFADALDHLRPDLLVRIRVNRRFACLRTDLCLQVVPADRYEALCAANAALVSRIPVAHFFGGDVTEGS